MKLRYFPGRSSGKTMLALKILSALADESKCICCGEEIPEGRQVCISCEKNGGLQLLIATELELIRVNVEKSDQEVEDGS